MRRETRRAWRQVALKSRRPPGHGQQRAGAREADHLESSVARGDEADDIVVVGIVIDPLDPCRVGGAGLGERSEGNVTGEEKENEQAPDSHIAEPTPAPPQGQALARGVLLDYDLFLGSQPRSPSRYFACLTFSHLSVRPPT